MKITVKSSQFFSIFMDNQATLEIELGSVTLDELLDHLCDQFGEDFKKAMYGAQSFKDKGKPRVVVLVNGKHYSTLPKLLNTQLSDGDEIALLPPVAGG